MQGGPLASPMPALTAPARADQVQAASQAPTQARPVRGAGYAVEGITDALIAGEDTTVLGEILGCLVATEETGTVSTPAAPIDYRVSSSPEDRGTGRMHFAGCAVNFGLVDGN